MGNRNSSNVADVADSVTKNEADTSQGTLNTPTGKSKIPIPIWKYSANKARSIRKSIGLSPAKAEEKSPGSPGKAVRQPTTPKTKSPSTTSPKNVKAKVDSNFQAVVSLRGRVSPVRTPLIKTSQVKNTAVKIMPANSSSFSAKTPSINSDKLISSVSARKLFTEPKGEGTKDSSSKKKIPIHGTSLPPNLKSHLATKSDSPGVDVTPSVENYLSPEITLQRQVLFPQYHNTPSPAAEIESVKTMTRNTVESSVKTTLANTTQSVSPRESPPLPTTISPSVSKAHPLRPLNESSTSATSKKSECTSSVPPKESNSPELHGVVKKRSPPPKIPACPVYTPIPVPKYATQTKKRPKQAQTTHVVTLDFRSSEATPKPSTDPKSVEKGKKRVVVCIHQQILPLVKTLPPQAARVAIRISADEKFPDFSKVYEVGKDKSMLVHECAKRPASGDHVSWRHDSIGRLMTPLCCTESRGAEFESGEFVFTLKCRQCFKTARINLSRRSRYEGSLTSAKLLDPTVTELVKDPPPTPGCSKNVPPLSAMKLSKNVPKSHETDSPNAFEYGSWPIVRKPDLSEPMLEKLNKRIVEMLKSKIKSLLLVKGKRKPTDFAIVDVRCAENKREVKINVYSDGRGNEQPVTTKVEKKAITKIFSVIRKSAKNPKAFVESLENKKELTEHEHSEEVLIEEKAEEDAKKNIELLTVEKAKITGVTCKRSKSPVTSLSKYLDVKHYEPTIVLIKTAADMLANMFDVTNSSLIIEETLERMHQLPESRLPLPFSRLDELSAVWQYIDEYRLMVQVGHKVHKDFFHSLRQVAPVEPTPVYRKLLTIVQEEVGLQTFKYDSLTPLDWLTGRPGDLQAGGKRKRAKRRRRGDGEERRGDETREEELVATMVKEDEDDRKPVGADNDVSDHDMDYACGEPAAFPTTIESSKTTDSSKWSTYDPSRGLLPPSPTKSNRRDLRDCPVDIISPRKGDEHSEYFERSPEKRHRRQKRKSKEALFSIGLH